MDIKERLSLEAVSAHTLESSEHLHRYELAASVFGGRRTLNLCCGIGYGSVLMSRSALSVVGVDRDQAAIDSARVVAADAANASFVTADAVTYLADHGSEFEAIVCFEGLEHLDRLPAAVELLVALAEQGTQLLLSVPNSKTFHEDNPYHVTDFGYEEAMALFGQFENAIVLHQHVAEGSLISADASAELDARLVLGDHGEPEYANTFVCAVNVEAIGGDFASARAHLTIAPWHNRYLKNLERANDELLRTNARLARGHLGRSDSAAAAYQALEHRLAEAERNLRERDEELAKVWERTRYSEQLVEQQRVRAEAAEALLTRRRLPLTRRAARKLLRAAAGRTRGG